MSVILAKASVYNWLTDTLLNLLLKSYDSFSEHHDYHLTHILSFLTKQQTDLAADLNV
jgi:hypothetical protein